MNEDRIIIQPFLDWLIDNKKHINFGSLFNDMEEYLDEIKAEKDKK